MNYQILFSGSSKTNITNLSSAELAQRVVKDKNIKRVASSVPYLTYTFGDTSLSSIDPDQTQQNAASDQGLQFCQSVSKAQSEARPTGDQKVAYSIAGSGKILS